MKDFKNNWHLILPLLLFAVFFACKDSIQHSSFFLGTFDYLYRPFVVDDRFRVSHLYQRTFAQNIERKVLLVGSSSLEVLLRVKPYRLGINSEPAHYMQVTSSLYDLYFERNQIVKLNPKKIVLYYSTLHLNDSTENLDIVDGRIGMEEIKTLLSFKEVLDNSHNYMSYYEYFMRKEYFLRASLFNRNYHDFIPSGFYSGILKLPTPWNNYKQDDSAKKSDRHFEQTPNTEAMKSYSRLAEDFNIYLISKMLETFKQHNIEVIFIEQRDNPLCQTADYNIHREESIKKLQNLGKSFSFSVVTRESLPEIPATHYSDCVHIDSSYLATKPDYIEALFTHLH